MGKSIEVERQIVSRLHRIEGQIRSLERVLGQDEPEQAVTQFEAVIAASKAALVLYLESIAETDPKLYRTLSARIIKKIG